MLLSQMARDNHIPEDLSILKRLKESVARFEKFNREYSDYKRFRDRVKKQKLQSIAGVADVRFTVGFIRKLIEESKRLEIEREEEFD